MNEQASELNFTWENKAKFIQTLNNEDKLRLSILCIDRVKNHITSKAFLDLYNLLIKYSKNEADLIDVRNQYFKCNNGGILIYCSAQSVYDDLVISAAQSVFYPNESGNHVIKICEIIALEVGLDKKVEKKMQMNFIKELSRGYHGCGYYKEDDEYCFLLEKY